MTAKNKYLIVLPMVPQKLALYWVSVGIKIGSDMSHPASPAATRTIMAAGGNGPLEPHKRPCDLLQCVELIGDNPLSKQIYFLWGVIGFMALKMLVCYSDDASRNIGAFRGP